MRCDARLDQRAFLFVDAGLTEIKTSPMRIRRIDRQRPAPAMKPFSNHRAKRSTALMALLVWLLALASGMANACLLEAPGGHSHDAANHASNAHHAHTLDGHAVTVDGDGDGDDADRDESREPCLKVCDDGASAQVKLQAGVDLTDPGRVAPLNAFTRNTGTSIVSIPNRYEILQVPIVGPPCRVRYSRLAL